MIEGDRIMSPFPTMQASQLCCLPVIVIFAKYFQKGDLLSCPHLDEITLYNELHFPVRTNVLKLGLGGNLVTLELS